MGGDVDSQRDPIPTTTRVLISRVQWYRAANADAPFIDIPIDPGYMANPSFTPTAADQSKYLKVTVFYARTPVAARFPASTTGAAAEAE